MRALVLTTSWPLRPGVLSGSFLRDLLRGLAARGWSFEVVTPADGAPAPAAEPGINVHPIASPGRLAHGPGMPETLAAEPWRWLLVPGLLAALRRAAARRLAAGDCDLVWSHWLLPAGAVGAGLARGAGLPHLITAHGSDVHLLERLTAVPLARRALRRTWEASALSAVSHDAARRVERALPGRTVAVRPLPAAAGRRRSHAGPPRLLFLGRFEPVKGPDLLLEACAAVPAGRLARVTLAGAGSLEPRLRRRARSLRHAVTFPGVLEGARKRRALAHADALVVPSRRLPGGRADGLPHAALEALAAGVPVIAPDEGALGDLVRRTGAGLLFPAAARARSRAERLAEALLALGRAPGTREELAARARAAGAAFHAPVALAGWDALLAAHARGGAR